MTNAIQISHTKKNTPHYIAQQGGDWGINSNIFNNFENSYPWLNIDGSMKSDEEISKLGQSWNAETWDNYLKATVEYQDNELLLEESMDDIKAYIANDFFNFLTTSESYEYLHAYVQEAISKKLAPKEAEVIRLRYFYNKSERETSEELKMNIETMKKYRKDALKKLKSFFKSKEALMGVKSLVLLRLLEDKTI